MTTPVIVKDPYAPLSYPVSCMVARATMHGGGVFSVAASEVPVLEEAAVHSHGVQIDQAQLVVAVIGSGSAVNAVRIDRSKEWISYSGGT